MRRAICVVPRFDIFSFYAATPREKSHLCRLFDTLSVDFFACLPLIFVDFLFTDASSPPWRAMLFDRRSLLFAI